MINLKSNKNRYIAIISAIIIIILIAIYIVVYEYSKRNFIKLSYDEINQKLENKDDFVLCISRTNCVHCQDFKPKLIKVSDKYNIKIYYINVDKLSKEKYEEFKNQFAFDGATPTTIIFKDGEEKTTASRIDGDVSMDKIVNKLKNNDFIKE